MACRDHIRRWRGQSIARVLLGSVICCRPAVKPRVGALPTAHLQLRLGMLASLSQSLDPASAGLTVHIIVTNLLATITATHQARPAEAPELERRRTRRAEVRQRRMVDCPSIFNSQHPRYDKETARHRPGRSIKYRAIDLPPLGNRRSRLVFGTAAPAARLAARNNASSQLRWSAGPCWAAWKVRVFTRPSEVSSVNRYARILSSLSVLLNCALLVYEGL